MTDDETDEDNLHFQARQAQSMQTSLTRYPQDALQCSTNKPSEDDVIYLAPSVTEHNNSNFIVRPFQGCCMIYSK